MMEIVIIIVTIVAFIVSRLLTVIIVWWSPLMWIEWSIPTSKDLEYLMKHTFYSVQLLSA